MGINRLGFQFDDRHRRLQIMVVDDEQQICDLIQGFLSQSGYVEHVVAAQNAFQARQKMQNQDFDLIIVDYAMQGKNGIQFVQDIRRSVKFSKIKVLLISGCIQEDNVLQAVQLQIKDILIKPFSRKQLLSKIYQMLNLKPEFVLIESEGFDREELKIDFDLDLNMDLDLDVDE